MFVFLRKHKIKFAIILTLLIVSLFVFFGGDDNTEYESITVERGDLVQEVSVTGRVIPKSNVELAFETSGKVAGVGGGIGDSVFVGEVIVSLDSSELLTFLLEAQALLRSEEVRLVELTKGTRIEDITIKQSEISQAELDLYNLYDDTSNIMRGSFTKADDVINRLISPLFDNDNTENPQLSFVSSSIIVQLDAESMRVSAGTSLRRIEEIILKLPIDRSGRDEALKDIRENLVEIDIFLISVRNALNHEASLSDATEDTYKTNLDTARSNINTEIATIDKKVQTINAQKSTIDKKQNELNLLLAGSTKEAIARQSAIVDKAAAGVDKIAVQIGKTKLRSPISGIVTMQNAKVGEIVKANEVIVEVLGVSGFKIETNVPEADIALVEIGDIASVTLDAYGNEEIFEASVVMIDPGEVVIEGVPTYKVTLLFEDERGLIRSGMTANVDINTDMRFGVIGIPNRAVEVRGSKKIVRIILGENELSEVEVTTGMRDSFGNIEIIEGLSEGDRVVTFMPK